MRFDCRNSSASLQFDMFECGSAKTTALGQSHRPTLLRISVCLFFFSPLLRLHLQILQLFHVRCGNIENGIYRNWTAPLPFYDFSNKDHKNEWNGMAFVLACCIHAFCFRFIIRSAITRTSKNY